MLRWLTDQSELVQITSIGWRDHDDGDRHELEVVMPQGTQCETFSKAELETPYVQALLQRMNFPQQP